VEAAQEFHFSKRELFSFSADQNRAVAVLRHHHFSPLVDQDKQRETFALSEM
jgi:hypothetical protein